MRSEGSGRPAVFPGYAEQPRRRGPGRGRENVRRVRRADGRGRTRVRGRPPSGPGPRDRRPERPPTTRPRRRPTPRPAADRRGQPAVCSTTGCPGARGGATRPTAPRPWGVRVRCVAPGGAAPYGTGASGAFWPDAQGNDVSLLHVRIAPTAPTAPGRPGTGFHPRTDARRPSPGVCGRLLDLRQHRPRLPQHPARVAGQAVRPATEDARAGVTDARGRLRGC